MDELSALSGAVRDVIRRGGGSASVRTAITTERRIDEALWQTLAEQVGVAALAVPEEFDGAGATVRELAAVLEVLGESLSPVPAFGSAALATGALLASGNDDACARLLPELASGELTAALCWAGPAGWDQPGVTATGADGTASTLDGTAEYVIDAESADVFLVVTDSGELHEVRADAEGVTVTPLPVLDATRPLARVSFANTPASALGSDPELPDRIRTLAWALLSAEQVGGAARSLALTVEHTSARKQFGRELASFQALKHTMADMYALVETMRSISAAAVDAVATGAADAAELAAAAHVYCSEGYVTVAGQAIQLHGGIGITAEHDIGLHFKRAQADAQLFGSPTRALGLIDV